MAFLVLLGASTQCIASLLCEGALCPNAETKPSVTRKGCCPETADHHGKRSEETVSHHGKRSHQGSCCCELKAAPEALPTEAKFVLPAPILLDALLPERLPQDSTKLIVCASLRIRESGDSSPPKRHAAPDRGRAPPAA